MFCKITHFRLHNRWTLWEEFFNVKLEFWESVMFPFSIEVNKQNGLKRGNRQAGLLKTVLFHNFNF